MIGRRIIYMIATIVGLVALGAFAQSSVDTFPVGTTTMIYQIQSEDLDEPQILELRVTAHGGDRYTVRMTTEQTGTEDDLATGFGFLFRSATVSSGAGNISYSSLQALMDQRSRLQEGQSYLLPGGGEFQEIEGVTIAGVFCLEGTFVDTRDEAVRMRVAFALSHPVYVSPRLLTEEKRGGVWVETFRLELVSYEHVEAEG